LIWLNSWRLSLALLSAAILSVGDVAAQAGTALHSATGSRTGLERSSTIRPSTLPALRFAKIVLMSSRRALVISAFTHRRPFGMNAPASMQARLHSLCHSTKKPIEAKAITAVASAPPRAIQRGKVRWPMIRGFIAIIIMIAISGAAKTPFTTALQ